MTTEKLTDNWGKDSHPFSKLTLDQCQKIHAASLDLLENYGIQLNDEEAIQILMDGGARVEGNIVFVQQKMVEKAFESAPHKVVLYNRLGEAVMPLEGSNCFYGPGSDTLNIIDHRDDKRRKPLLEDVCDGTVLCDALPNIDFLMSMVIPGDVDQTIADTYQMEVMLNNTIKPIITVAYELSGLIDQVEMAEAVMGGADALREKPILTCYINVVSGLVHNQEALQKLLYLSGKGLPSIYVPSTIAGTNSPITPVGAVTLDNAGVLLGLVLSQLNRAGAPFIMPGMPPAPMDMRTMVSPYAYPVRGIFQAMARMYGLPAFGLGGAADAKIVDQQAAAEAALSLLAEAIVGGNIIHDLGYLESGLTFSLTQLAICDDIAGWVKAFTRDIEVSGETLALDVIRAVGREGSYLGHGHTRDHCRDEWYPNIFERDAFPIWKQKGEKTLNQRARERVEEILENHVPEPLDPKTAQKIRSIVVKRAASVSSK